MNNPKKQRIFLGLSEVCGIYANLSKGFRDLGYEADFYDVIGHKFSYGASKESKLANMIKVVHAKRMTTSNVFSNYFLYAIFSLLKILLFINVVFKYEVFIFGFGSTFCFNLDYYLLRMLGKKTIFFFHGSDCRPPYLDGVAIEEYYNENSSRGIIKQTDRLRRKAKAVEANASYIINWLPQSHFYSRKFISIYNAGLPICVEPPGLEESEQTAELDLNQKKVRILHSPSTPQFKGSDVIKKMINELIEEGLDIEFIEIRNMPNIKVLEAIQKCDFVVDQTYSDTSLAVFATEAAIYAKPAVVGGAFAKYIRDHIDESLIPPAAFCSLDEMKDSIRELILNREYRLSLGLKAQKYVLENWNIHQITKNYIQMIEDTVPESWFYDPSHINYVCPAGVTDEISKKVIFDMISESGVSCLGVQDKPNLERLLNEYANS